MRLGDTTIQDRETDLRSSPLFTCHNRQRALQKCRDRLPAKGRPIDVADSRL